VISAASSLPFGGFAGLDPAKLTARRKTSGAMLEKNSFYFSDKDTLHSG